ncbi:cytochrome b561 and DOMON domain-containing protein At5g47530-like [Prosopis cineraria]|uniref:cytochrome b561 and DOMON domain-containing protein At5g47530-like n=1 Tax=Prosopis cineraria TaxID=364024 RepID=UPI002410609D|nr:cytochrome b561 and DOMON domain-containing protein At5g47530-like [Prosopis cineraria]
MDSLRKLALFLALFFALIISIIPVTSQPQACESYKFPNTKNFAACTDLPFLDSSLHWNYYSSSNSVDIAFKKNRANPDGWIAWAINPTSRGMVGSQAFVAFQKSDGTMAAYTSPITSYGTTLEEGSVVGFEVHGVSASLEDGTMILYASFRLPGNSTTTVNHVWQEGSVSDNVPQSHGLSRPNLRSFGQMDFLTGKVSDHGANLDNSRILIRKMHGIFNGIGWGILMPMGAMMARYLKAFEVTRPRWFHVHRACQILAYLFGSAGFALGIYMSTNLSLSAFHLHASVGIAVFTISTVQILFAIFFRPHKTHKTRIFWNVFHYVLGYGVIVLAIFNMFRGFSISNYPTTWKNPYFGFTVLVGSVALVLEVLTWFLVCKRRIETKKNQVSNDDNISQISQNQEVP